MIDKNKKQTKITSLEEYNNYINENKGIILLTEAISKTFTKSNLERATFKGFCSYCENDIDFIYDLTDSYSGLVNFRETLLCPDCLMNNRKRASFLVIDEIINNRKNLDIYCYEQITYFFENINKKYGDNNITGSEFIDYNIPSGEIVNGIRNENALDLSFKDGSFDIIISNDVYEHVPDIQKTLEEAYRVLKTDGKLTFSVPFAPALEKTEARAEIVDGKLALLKEKQIHGNPMSEEGSLVFYDFGWDLLDLAKQVGFRDAYAMPVLNEEYGNLSYFPILIFIAEK